MTPGEQIAQVAHELLDPGPMSRSIRAEDYKRFIRANFIDTPAAPVFTSGGTHCAIFARACLTQAGIMPIGRRPLKTAITTWLGVKGFIEDDPGTKLIEGAWIPADEWTPEVGDVPYICGGTAQSWPYAKNGHVFILVDGSGPMWVLAQGGGGKDGSLCRKSDGPRNIFDLDRVLRGAWRPALMIKPADTEPAPPLEAT
jgi:hypothetical protein